MPRIRDTIAISAYTAVSALGTGLAAHLEALRQARSGLRPNSWSLNGDVLPCAVGRVEGVEQAAPLPGAADTRLHRLLNMVLDEDQISTALQAARQRHGATRIALVLGSSTGNIETTETAYRHLDSQGRLATAQRNPQVHHIHAPAAALAAHLGIQGPALTVSTACSSGAKAFGLGAQLLRADLADAVLVGGADSLCASTLYGFNSLQLVATGPCRPFDLQRHGLSVGEAAALALLTRDQDAPGTSPRLLACGEGSDAYHLSAPHPQALGAKRAVCSALHAAGLEAGDIDYLNLHGTASRQNDAVEANLVAQLFPAQTRASSTKGASGHCLGAAGALEAILSLLALEHGLVPANLGCRTPEPDIAANLALSPESGPLGLALSFSLGFGGSNVCLALARAEALR